MELLSRKYNPARAECLERRKARIEWSWVGTESLGRAAVVQEGDQVSREAGSSIEVDRKEIQSSRIWRTPSLILEMRDLKGVRASLGIGGNCGAINRNQ